MTRWLHQTALAALVVLVVGLGSCSEPTVSPDDEASQVERPPILLPPEGDVVAKVDGAPITRQQVEAAQKRMGDATPEEALADLIEVEVLSQEAVKRGLEDRPSIRAANRRALVQRLLEEEVEDEITPESVDPKMVRKAYDKFAIQFFVPELVTVSHILLTLPEDQRTPEDLKRATALAKEIETRLEASDTPVKLLDDLRLEADLRGFVAQVDKHITFPRHQIPPLTGKRSPYLQVVDEFAKAAFALDGDHRMSGPVVTSFGVHVIVFQDRSKALRPPFEAVAGEIEDDFLQRHRGERLRSLIERLYASAKIETDEEPIKELAERANELTGL